MSILNKIKKQLKIANFSQNKQKGFTLIELLVVIAIIGILSTLSVVALMNAREQSKATKIVSDFKQLEKSLYMLMDHEGGGIWWRENFWSGGDNPTFETISSNSDFGVFMKSLPTPPIAGTTYRYDNDGNTMAETGGNVNGVNIFVYSVSSFSEFDKFFTLVDKIIDDGDGVSNGKIRGHENRIIVYNIALNEIIY